MNNRWFEPHIHWLSPGARLAISFLLHQSKPDHVAEFF